MIIFFVVGQISWLCLSWSVKCLSGKFPRMTTSRVESIRSIRRSVVARGGCVTLCDVVLTFLGMFICGTWLYLCEVFVAPVYLVMSESDGDQQASLHVNKVTEKCFSIKPEILPSTKSKVRNTGILRKKLGKCSLST